MSKYIEHTTISGERWDLLAHRYYGDANKAGIIIDANPQLAIIETFAANTTVMIPIISASVASNSDLPPWLRD